MPLAVAGDLHAQHASRPFDAGVLQDPWPGDQILDEVTQRHHVDALHVSRHPRHAVREADDGLDGRRTPRRPTAWRSGASRPNATPGPRGSGCSSTIGRPRDTENAPGAGQTAIRNRPVAPATIRSAALESVPEGTHPEAVGVEAAQLLGQARQAFEVCGIVRRCSGHIVDGFDSPATLLETARPQAPSPVMTARSVSPKQMNATHANGTQGRSRKSGRRATTCAIRQREDGEDPVRVVQDRRRSVAQQEHHDADQRLDAGHDLDHRHPDPEALARVALGDPRDQAPDPAHGEQRHHEEPDVLVDLDHEDGAYAARSLPESCQCGWGVARSGRRSTKPVQQAHRDVLLVDHRAELVLRRGRSSASVVVCRHRRGPQWPCRSAGRAARPRRSSRRDRACDTFLPSRMTSLRGPRG